MIGVPPVEQAVRQNRPERMADESSDFIMMRSGLPFIFPVSQRNARGKDGPKLRLFRGYLFNGRDQNVDILASGAMVGDIHPYRQFAINSRR